MNYFLIDFENVKTDGIKDLSGVCEGDALIVFYSENCKNITLDVMESITKLNLQFRAYKASTGTKNALDFQLVSYLGYIIGKADPSSKFYIVSNDKGYDCLQDYWKNFNVTVERILLQNSNPAVEKETKTKKATKAAKSKVATADRCTLEEIKKYLSKDDMPEEVLVIFNQYKTKQAICNGISKKCKDSKRTSSIYKKLKPLLKEKKKS